MNKEGKQENSRNPAEWLAQVEKRLGPDHNMRCVPPSVSIYRVPIPMFSLKPQCYLPRIVALGPYHCQMSPKLSQMEEYKVEAVHRTVKRIPNITAMELIAEVEKWEDKIRMSYEEALDYDRKTLASMLTMDACFILEFLKSYGGDIPNDVEPLSLVFRSYEHQNIVTQEIGRDILKLENQIPFFVLRGILALQVRDLDPDLALEPLVRPLMEFGGCFNFWSSEICAKHIKNVDHLLDLFHKATEDFLRDSLGSARSDDISGSNMHCSLRMTNGLCCFPSPACRREASSHTPIINRSAEALQKVGVQIGHSKTNKIHFEKQGFGRSSTFYLPQIKISDATEPMLLNLVAFEACKMHNRPMIIARFVYFLVYLITSQKDIALLSQEEVILNYMGSDEKAAAIFKDLCDGTVVDGFPDFESVLEAVEEHCKSRTNLWVSQLKEEYCSKPWYLISLAAAVVLLVLTFVQTIYSTHESN